MIHSIHRGQYLQRGRGLGGIFSSIFRVLKPIFSKSLSIGRKALSDPTVKQAVGSLKKSSIRAGTRAINKEINKIAPVKLVPKKSVPPPKAAVAKKRSSKIGNNSIKKNKKVRTGANVFNDF